MTPKFLSASLLLGLLAGTATALAHEFWLQPPQFFVAPGTRQQLHVFVGTDFAGVRWAGTGKRLTSFLHYTPTDTLDQTKAAAQPDSLAMSLEFARPGLHLVALSTTNAFLQLEAEPFNTYLKEAGLEAVLALRQQRGQLAKPGREAYRRCAKTLIQVGPLAADSVPTYAWQANQPLELVPDQNPYSLPVGAALTVRVLALGQPVAGALVQVWQRAPGQPAQHFALRSNQMGRILFRLKTAGSCLVSTVRMLPAADPKTADWQSTWATLTFGVAGNLPR